MPEFIERARRAQEGHDQTHDVQLRMNESYTIDKYGRVWSLPWEELCPTCGQPLVSGVCGHVRLSDDEVAVLLAKGGEPDAKG